MYKWLFLLSLFALCTFPCTIWSLQVNISAYDLGEPTSRRITGQITVTVRRNNFPPEILNLYYEMDINENRAVATNTNPLYTVLARDNDTMVKFLVLLIIFNLLL